MATVASFTSADLKGAPGGALFIFSTPSPRGAYTHSMRSVADDLRDELQEEVLRLPFEERIALVLRLGERGLEMFRQANGLDRETAIRELQRQRQAGRTPSKCMSELIG
jgi:hypothetical protein